MSSSLIALLNNSLNNYNDTDSNWRQFISDHKTYLIANSKIRNLSPSYFQGVQYNLKAYLRKINYMTNCAWIVALINNIPNDVNFAAGIGFLYIPNFSIIEALYTTYITTKNNG